MCLFLFTYSLLGQDINKYKSISWRVYNSLNWKDYVDYKSEEWKNMSFKEKGDLLQIPTIELQTMSTDELIEASIDSYFARGIGKFSTINSYYETIYNCFNGFRELIMRKDVVIKMINHYKVMNLRSESLSQAGLSMKKQVQILEYLIVHPKVLERFTSDQFSQLLSILKEKYTEKTNMISTYSEQDIIPNVYAIARLLENKDPQTRLKLHAVDQIDMFLGSGIFLTHETLNQILAISKGL